MTDYETEKENEFRNKLNISNSLIGNLSKSDCEFIEKCVETNDVESIKVWVNSTINVKNDELRNYKAEIRKNEEIRNITITAIKTFAELL